MMLTKLLATLTKAGQTRTAADLRADLVKVDLPGLDAKVAEIENERRGLLLRGSDADLERNAKALAAAKLEVERGQAATEELTRLIAEAETREGAAAIEAEAAEIQRAVHELASIYARIDAVTADLQKHFAEAAPLAAKVDAWNQRGHKLGRPRLVFTALDIIKQRTAGALR